MKITLNRLLIVAIIATLIGGYVVYGDKGLAYASNVSKAQTYENLLQPEIGSYYSVQSVTKKDNSIFVIGQKVTPLIGGKVSPEGQLVTIEVPPAKGTGLMKGSYLTVTIKNNAEVTRFFLDQQSVVQHALDN